MLHGSLKVIGALLCLTWHADAMCQIGLDRSILLNGSSDQRRIIGLAPPVSDGGAITVEVASSGLVHWAAGTRDADTIRLMTTPAVSAYRDGLLLRFSAVGDDQIAPWLQVSDLPACPMVRADRLPVQPGELGASGVAEVLWVDGSWILLNTSRSTCPPGSLAVNDRLCIDQESHPGLLFHEAIDHCGTRGGRLCNWDEYVAGCTLAGGQLTGLFNEWEWLNDTSNHTQTADQAGRFTCQSQRSASVITVQTGDTRCCFHPR